MRKAVPCRCLLALVLFVLFSSESLNAQSFTFGNGKLEAGVGVGPLFFLGDLGGNRGMGSRFVKDVNMPLVRMAKGVFVQYYPKEWLGVRLAANMGRLEGDDTQISGKGGYEEARLTRNLHFRTDLKEAYLAFEFSPTVFFEKYDGLGLKLRPYVIGGVGVFHFNPQARYYKPDGSYQWVDLQPLHTEGQGMAEYPDRKNYKLTQLEIPFGVGVKYYLNDNLFIGLEVMHRKTFTDYIDDVSTTFVDPRVFDRYMSPEQAAMAVQLNNRVDFDPATNNVSRSPTLGYGPGDQRGNPKQTDAFFSTILRMGWRFADVFDSDRRAMRMTRCPAYY